MTLATWVLSLRARLFAALATIQVLCLAIVAAPVVSGATTSKATTGTQASAAGPVHRSMVQGTNGNDTISTKRRAQEVYGLAGDDYIRLAVVTTSPTARMATAGCTATTVATSSTADRVTTTPRVAPATIASTAAPGTTSWTATGATTGSSLGPANDQVTDDEGDDVIYPGPGADEIYGEEGNNTIIATDDGVRNDIFCDMIKVATPPGTIIYIGHRDPLDGLRNCKVVVRPSKT